MAVVCVPKMYWDAPMQMVAQQPAAMLRCLKMRGGIVAVLGRRIWMAAKATSKMPARVNSAMIRPELHWEKVSTRVQSRGHASGNSRHTCCRPTGVPAGDRPRQGSELRIQGHQAGPASVSRESWWCLCRGP